MGRPLPDWEKKKLVGLMKEQLGGKTIKWFDALRAKTYSYLTDNNDKDTKSKDTKCVDKKQLKFEDYKHCLEATQFENEETIQEKIIWCE